MGSMNTVYHVVSLPIEGQNAYFRHIPTCLGLFGADFRCILGLLGGLAVGGEWGLPSHLVT